MYKNGMGKGYVWIFLHVSILVLMDLCIKTNDAPTGTPAET